MSAPDSTYWRLKARLLARPAPPRQILRIGTLAEELGTSGTPVREALIRLATEKLVVYVPKKGFAAKTLSAAELHAMYFLNHTLLHAAIAESRCERAESPEQEPLTHASTTEVGATELARSTAALFLRIATEYGNEEIAAIVLNLNDRLHHARVAEALVVENRQQELATLTRLYSANHRAELGEGIRSYHERRIALLTAIHRELVLAPFTKNVAP